MHRVAANSELHPSGDELMRTESSRPGLSLPIELYLLFVGPEEPAWTQLTLQLDRHGCLRPRFHWCSRLSEAARMVNQDHFDCVIVDDSTYHPSGGRDSAVGLEPAALSALRTGGCLDPLLVISDRVDDAWLAAMAEVDAELLITRLGWKSTALIPWIRCAIDRHTLAREHREVGREGRERRAQENTASHRQFEQRTALAQRLRKTDPSGRQWNAWNDDDSAAYVDLLRSAVLSDGPQLERLIEQTVSQWLVRSLTPLDVFDLHVRSVEILLQGLGGRSARHLLQRTDLLGWEILLRFAQINDWAPAFRTVGDSGLELSPHGERHASR